MDPNEKTLNTKKIIQIDKYLIQNKITEVVKDTMVDILNKILDAETEVLCNAERYQRTDARKGTRCP